MTQSANFRNIWWMFFYSWYIPQYACMKSSRSDDFISCTVLRRSKLLSVFIDKKIQDIAIQKQVSISLFLSLLSLSQPCQLGIAKCVGGHWWRLWCFMTCVLIGHDKLKFKSLQWLLWSERQCFGTSVIWFVRIWFERSQIKSSVDCVLYRKLGWIWHRMSIFGRDSNSFAFSRRKVCRRNFPNME